MSIKSFTVFLWFSLIGAAAVAGEGHETHIKIKVDSDGDVFEWHSDDSDLDLDGLEVGETRTLTSKDGKEATVTRTEDGLVFEADGKTIDIMKLHGDSGIPALHGDHDVVIDTEKRIKIIKSGGNEAVTIISAAGIDADKKARIEAALEEAGVDGEILFLDGGELHEDGHAEVKREVRVIRKDKDATD